MGPSHHRSSNKGFTPKPGDPCSKLCEGGGLHGSPRGHTGVTRARGLNTGIALRLPPQRAGQDVQVQVLIGHLQRGGRGRGEDGRSET